MSFLSRVPGVISHLSKKHGPMRDRSGVDGPKELK
jgi:hypothetical protein